MAPARNSASSGEGRHRQSSTQPVFADPTGRRQRWVKRGAATVGVFLSGYLALVVVTLSGRPNLLSIAVPGAASSKPNPTRFAEARQDPVFRSTTHPSRMPSHASRVVVPGITPQTPADSDPDDNSAASTAPPPSPTPTPLPSSAPSSSYAPIPSDTPPTTIEPTTSAGPTSGPPFRPSVRPPWFKVTPSEQPTIRPTESSPPGKTERHRHHRRHHPRTRPSQEPTNTPSDWPTHQEEQQPPYDSMSVPSAS